MKVNFTAVLYTAFAICMQSCKQDLPNPTFSSNSATDKTSQLQSDFAKSLSQALEDNPSLRKFLQRESIKRFDGDSDILYQVVKDISINNEKTFHELLTRYIDEDKLYAIEHELPLLTIFVPTLPNGFTPETWEPERQTPLVAVRNIGENTVPLFDAKGNKSIINPGNIPGFPVLVIKQNERVLVNENTGTKIRSFHRNQLYSFSFKDTAFDGLSNNSSNATKNSIHNSENSVEQNNRTVFAYSNPDFSDASPISVRNIRAYEIDQANPNVQWQRDYVYYGITPAVPRGPLRTNYRETVRTMKLTIAGINKMSGYAGDPGAPIIGGPIYTQTGPAPYGGPGIWTDGYYEFLLLVTTNSKDGSPSPRTFRFSVRPTDLYNISYRIGQSGNPNVTWYTITGVTPIDYHANISIGTWDLSNFGVAWTYHIYEENQTVDVTEKTTTSSTYAINFEFDPTFSGFVKGGAKFGITGSRNESTEITKHYITGSTDLGEQVLNFYDPIILSSIRVLHPNLGPYAQYETYEPSTGGAGGYISMSIEPRSIISQENLTDY